MTRRPLLRSLLIFVSGVGFAVPAATAMACQFVDYHPTPKALTQDARAFYEQEAFVYEGVLLGAHDYESGGRFLVVKPYKGPAKPFTILKLPGGSSCYAGVAPFSVGFWSGSIPPFAFDGLVARQYVESWKRQGLVGSDLLTPSRFIVALMLLLVVAPAALFVWRLRKRQPKSK